MESKEEDIKKNSTDASEVLSSEGLAAIVVGGTGAVGKALIPLLLNSSHYSSVTSIGRREVPLPENLKDNKKLKQVIIDMDELEKTKEEFEGKDVAFCCLGTTRKQAGSAEAFRKIDFDLVVKFGELAKDAKVNHFSLVSSTGADASSFFLYPKTKGEVENAIKKLGFNTCSIFRPGLMDRGSDTRLVEKIFGVFGSIQASSVAAAMAEDGVKVKSKQSDGGIFGNGRIHVFEKEWNQ